MAAQVRGMLELKKMGAAVFEFGNGIRAQALARGVADACEIPGFVSEYLLPDLAQGRSPLTAVALSGDPGDLTRIDDLFPELFPDSDLREWIAIARKHPSPGLPARSYWMRAGEAIKLVLAINDLVARGEIKGPVAIGRPIRRNRSTSPLLGQPSAQAALLDAANGASWLSLQAAAGPDEGLESTSSFVVLADGKPKMAERLARLFANDFKVTNSLFRARSKDPGSS
jgi:urocanate hydratase